MTKPLSPSPAAFALVKRFEGFRAEAAPAPGGGYVFGYGHIGGQPPAELISESEAERLLSEDLDAAAAAVWAVVFAPLSQQQFDALVSLCFSIGVEAFAGSEVVRRLNAGEPIAAAIAFEAFRVGAAGGGAPQILDALVRRRAAEQALFLTLDAGATAAPSALLRLAGAPDAAAPTGVDPLTSRLIEILRANPDTARVLEAPAATALADEEDEEAPPLRRSASGPGDGGEPRLLGLAIVGALLVAVAAFAAASGFRLGIVLFGAPGLIAVLIAGYYLLKPPPLGDA